MFLALAAWRLSRRNVLTRRVDAIEVLGAITVLAADKTGTLTLDKMALVELAAAFIFAVHVTIVALAPVPALLNWPPLMLPAQIVLLELSIDPACSILFEAQPEEDDLMNRPPKPATDSPFALGNMAYGLLQGLGLALVLLLANRVMRAADWPAAEMRSTLLARGAIGLLAIAACVALWLLALRQVQRRRAGRHRT